MRFEGFCIRRIFFLGLMAWAIFGECKQTSASCSARSRSTLAHLLPRLSTLYGVCGSQNYRRFGSRATDMIISNAGPKLHWRVWEKGGFLTLTLDPYFLANNNGHNGYIWA